MTIYCEKTHIVFASYYIEMAQAVESFLMQNMEMVFPHSQCHDLDLLMVHAVCRTPGAPFTNMN